MQLLSEERIELTLEKSQSALLNDGTVQRLQQALCDHFDRKVQLGISLKEGVETPATIAQKINNEKLQQAADSLKREPLLKQIITDFTAKIIDGSIKLIT